MANLTSERRMWNAACMKNAKWLRLAEEVAVRRRAIGASQEDLVRRGGPSHQSIRNIERAAQDDYRPLTLSKLENVLGWKPGTVESILDNSASANREEWLAPKENLPAVQDDSDADTHTAQDDADPEDEIASPWTFLFKDPETGAVLRGVTLRPSTDPMSVLTRAGFDFIDMAQQHRPDDPETAQLRHAVLTYINHVLTKDLFDEPKVAD